MELKASGSKRYLPATTPTAGQWLSFNRLYFVWKRLCLYSLFWQTLWPPISQKFASHWLRPLELSITGPKLIPCVLPRPHKPHFSPTPPLSWWPQWGRLSAGPPFLHTSEATQVPVIISYSDVPENNISQDPWSLGGYHLSISHTSGEVQLFCCSLSVSSSLVEKRTRMLWHFKDQQNLW